MDPAAGSNFITMGTTQFQYVAYAQFAKSIDAENIVGIVPISSGGTGVNTLGGLKTALTLDKVNNTDDFSKPISTLTKNALDLKLNVTDIASMATKLANARNINGIAFDGSGDITISADAGTLIGANLKSTVTGSSLTSVGALVAGSVPYGLLSGVVPTWNQSTTGNAATATTAGNITSASNITLTSLSNLSTVGTIKSGVWSGTTIDVAHGGTGSNSMAQNNILLGNGVNALQTVAPGTSGFVLTSNGTTWISAASTAPVAPIAETLTGTTIASNVVNSSLTSLGTLSNATINGKLVVGAPSEYSSSAILEAQSTTKGFLPPRLNYYQRTQIASPVAGLIIWCTNCGASGELQIFNGGAWTNTSGGTSTTTISLSIGDSYQGGKVFYILQSGDIGYDPNTQHGLIASTSDQSAGTRIWWYNGSYITTGATGTAIGTGFSNTNLIIASQGATAISYAAGLARSYTGGGYNDWFLPSKDELNKLHQYRLAIGGFDSWAYYSSSEISNNSAWYQDFPSGAQNAAPKESSNFVRAIRAF